MSNTLIVISLLILLGLGIAALFLGGKSHDSSSVEDVNKKDE